MFLKAFEEDHFEKGLLSKQTTDCLGTLMYAKDEEGEKISSLGTRQIFVSPKLEKLIQLVHRPI